MTMWTSKTGWRVPSEDSQNYYYCSKDDHVTACVEGQLGHRPFEKHTTVPEWVVLRYMRLLGISDGNLRSRGMDFGVSERCDYRNGNKWMVQFVIKKDNEEYRLPEFPRNVEPVSRVANYSIPDEVRAQLAMLIG